MEILLPTIIAVFAIAFLLSAFLLWLAARWMKAPRASFGRAMLVVAILSVFGLASAPAHLQLGRLFTPDETLLLLVTEFLLLVVELVIAWLLIRFGFQTTFGKAILIWLIQLVPSVALGFLMVYGLKAGVTEAFVISANSMAPTIIGWHRLDTCPHCQGTLIVADSAPGDPFQRLLDDEERPCICAACRKSTTKSRVTTPLLGPDRILVNKLIGHRRWDIVVFRYPREPSQKYIDRLIGLPGETVFIKDGAVWIDGAKMDPPASLAGQHYTSEMPWGGRPWQFATEKNPLRLQADEYFVLGDFSNASSDSRDWGPVPGGNIEGVVGLCYWPTERWNVFR